MWETNPRTSEAVLKNVVECKGREKKMEVLKQNVEDKTKVSQNN